MKPIKKGMTEASTHGIAKFAPVEYEWQWLIYDKEYNTFELTVHYKSEEEAKESIRGYTLIKRIEESKREVLTD